MPDLFEWRLSITMAKIWLMISKRAMSGISRRAKRIPFKILDDYYILAK